MAVSDDNISDDAIPLSGQEVLVPDPRPVDEKHIDEAVRNNAKSARYNFASVRAEINRLRRAVYLRWRQGLPNDPEIDAQLEWLIDRANQQVPGGRHQGLKHKQKDARAYLDALGWNLPLTFLLEVVNDEHGIWTREQQLQAAVAAMPYLHPRLIAKQVVVKTEEQQRTHEDWLQKIGAIEAIEVDDGDGERDDGTEDGTTVEDGGDRDQGPDAATG